MWNNYLLLFPVGWLKIEPCYKSKGTIDHVVLTQISAVRHETPPGPDGTSRQLGPRGSWDATRHNWSEREHKLMDALPCTISLVKNNWIIWPRNSRWDLKSGRPPSSPRGLGRLWSSRQTNILLVCTEVKVCFIVVWPTVRVCYSIEE